MSSSSFLAGGDGACVGREECFLSVLRLPLPFPKVRHYLLSLFLLPRSSPNVPSFFLTTPPPFFHRRSPSLTLAERHQFLALSFFVTLIVFLIEGNLRESAEVSEFGQWIEFPPIIWSFFLSSETCHPPFLAPQVGIEDLRSRPKPKNRTFPFPRSPP